MTTEKSLLVVPCIFTDVTDVGQYWVQTCNSQATLNLSSVGSGFLPVVDGLSSKKATQAQAAWIVNNLNGFAAKFRSIQSSWVVAPFVSYSASLCISLHLSASLCVSQLKLSSPELSGTI